MRPVKVGLAAAVAVILAFGFTVAPAFASSTPIEMSGMPYNNVFLWFGANTFNDNVQFGTWSNCPYDTAATPTTTCTSTALTNAGWDVNDVGYVGNCNPSSGFSDWCLTLKNGNDLVMNASFIEPLLCSIGYSCFSSAYAPTVVGHVAFHQIGDSGVWFADPASNEMNLFFPKGYNLPNGIYSYNFEGGTLVFDGAPSPSTFVSGTLYQWAYLTPAAYSYFQTACFSLSGSSCLPDAAYVPSLNAYLELTSVISLSSTLLSSSALLALISSTPYLGTTPS